MTLAESVASLLADLRLRNYSAGTLKHYADQLKFFGEWLTEELSDDLRRITKADIDSYQRYVRTESIGVETQALRLRAVKRLFDHLTTNGQLLLHPAEHIVEMKRRDRLPKSVLSVKQVTKLIESPDVTTPLGIRDRALLELLYSTAIRVGELEHVLTANVDFSDETLFVRKGKGGRERTVPLGTTAAEWVKRYLNEVRPSLLKTRQDERVLFLTHHGKPLVQTQVREILKKYKARCHLRKSCSPHMLRHACATHLLEAGADIRVIQELLGHAQLDSTTIYTHVRPINVKAVHENYHPGEVGDKGAPPDVD